MSLIQSYLLSKKLRKSAINNDHERIRGNPDHIRATKDRVPENVIGTPAKFNEPSDERTIETRLHAQLDPQKIRYAQNTEHFTLDLNKKCLPR